MVPLTSTLLIVFPTILMMSIFGYIYFVRKRYYKDETTNTNGNTCKLLIILLLKLGALLSY